MKKFFTLFLPLIFIFSTFTVGEAFEVKISGSDSIAEKKTTRLTVEFIPTQPNQSGTWVSSNENIARVDKNGIVTGIAVGEAHITFTASADVSVFDIFPFNITKGENNEEKKNIDALKSAGCNSGKNNIPVLIGFIILLLYGLVYVKKSKHRNNEEQA